MAKATLTWNANAEKDLAGYNVYKNGVKIATVAAPTTTYVDNTLSVDGDYTYDLTAFDTAGNESAHSVSVTKTVNTVPPQAPTGLTVVLG